MIYFFNILIFEYKHNWNTFEGNDIRNKESS